MMKKSMYVMLCLSLGVLCGTAQVLASPDVNSAVITTRIWNDNPTSIVTTSNSYPSSLTIKDEQIVTGGFGNLHNFRLSTDGSTAASFANADAFAFASDVTITGTAVSEAGLQIAPWWDLTGGGRLQIRADAGGEIAAFGGRLPFYSFTGSQSLTYTLGDTVRLGVVYRPNSNNISAPATIEYLLTMGVTDYTSGEIAFDSGNILEGYGEYGMLDSAQVGGFFQPRVAAVAWEQVEFGDMVYVPEPATMALLGLGSLFLARRRK